MAGGRPTDDQIARAQAGLQKQAAGRDVSREERRAISKYRAWQEAQARARHYNEVPKSDWVSWSGVTAPTIYSQAREMGFPWPFDRGAAVVLPLVVSWLHNFLKTHRAQLLPDDSRMPAIERKRLADARRSEFQLEQDMGVWLKRDHVHLALTKASGLLRTAGEALQRQFGPEARKILDDALDDQAREFKRLFEDDGGGDDP